MDPVLIRALLVAAGIALVAGLGWAMQRRDGRLRTNEAADDDAPTISASHLDAVGLELAPGARAAVLLGSPTCTPCVQVRAILRELERDVDGFRWVYADAGDHLELARAHRVLRVPTLLVLDDAAQVIGRTSGVPDPDALRALLEGRDGELAA